MFTWRGGRSQFTVVYPPSLERGCRPSYPVRPVQLTHPQWPSGVGRGWIVASFDAKSWRGAAVGRFASERAGRSLLRLGRGGSGYASTRIRSHASHLRAHPCTRQRSALTSDAKSPHGQAQLGGGSTSRDQVGVCPELIGAGARSWARSGSRWQPIGLQRAAETAETYDETRALAACDTLGTQRHHHRRAKRDRAHGCTVF